MTIKLGAISQHRKTQVFGGPAVEAGPLRKTQSESEVLVTNMEIDMKIRDVINLLITYVLYKNMYFLYFDVFCVCFHPVTRAISMINTGWQLAKRELSALRMDAFGVCNVEPSMTRSPIMPLRVFLLRSRRWASFDFEHHSQRSRGRV